MNLSSGQKLIVVIVLIVVVAAAAFFLLLLPKFSQMTTLDDQIAATESDIASAQSLLEQRQAQKSRSAQTEAQLLALSNELPENPEIPSLIVELQDTVNTSGMEFVSLEPAVPEVREEGYSAIVSTMFVRGSWQDMVDLLQRLRRITRQIRITEFEVIPSETDEDQPEPFQIEATVMIEIYTMSPDLVNAGVATPAPPAE